MTTEKETDDSRSSPVEIQTAAQSLLSAPSWLGEVAVIAHSLQHQGILSGIDFAVVLLGYAIKCRWSTQEKPNTVGLYIKRSDGLVRDFYRDPSPLSTSSLFFPLDTSAWWSICFCPQSAIRSRMGLRVSPQGVREYSTFGGTSL